MLARALLFTASLLGSLAVSGVAAAPATTSADGLLQYALTLEHLDEAFYKVALEKFSEREFRECGVERTLIEQIAEHEVVHVQVLQSLLGSKATKPCEHSFPDTDVPSFKALAQTLEGMGASAYIGAAQYVTNKPLLTAAAVIIATEARHAAWLATTNDRDPWAGAFETPLALSQVYSIAAPFIVSCPATNPPLPVRAFPALTLAAPANGSIKPNSTLTLTVPHDFAYDADADCLYVAFLSGLGVAYVPYRVNGTVVVPQDVASTGTIYAVLTNSNSSATDDTTVAGPVVLVFEGHYPHLPHSCDSSDESEGSGSQVAGSGTPGTEGRGGDGAGEGARGGGLPLPGLGGIL
ncbi:hypothetical protein AURDEDRAFT_181905 [Auricularia subglabra TFB-10046 SS5]|nr:hypothetical protein AURDEDRAFT_181905 [Auricularia subglabra TFB-10046 SS5]